MESYQVRYLQLLTEVDPASDTDPSGQLVQESAAFPLYVLDPHS